MLGTTKNFRPNARDPPRTRLNNTTSQFSLPSTGDPCIIHKNKNGPVESECKLNNVNPHIIRNQIQNQIEVTLNEHRYCKLCHYQTNTEFWYSIQISSESPMEYSRRPTKSIPKENQLKILNKIYQTYLVSTTILLWTNFGEILIEIQNFSFTKKAAENIVWEMGAILSRWRWANITCLSPPGLRVNKKTVLPGYRNSHIKDKTVLRPSYLYNGNFYADKTAFIHWDGSRGPNLLMRVNFPAWISNYIHYKVLVVITYTFSNFIKLKFLNG